MTTSFSFSNMPSTTARPPVPPLCLTSATSGHTHSHPTPSSPQRSSPSFTSASRMEILYPASTYLASSLLVSPTGTATSATSNVTVVGSMSGGTMDDAGYRDMAMPGPSSSNATGERSNTAKSSPVRAAHNNRTPAGLPSPPTTPEEDIAADTNDNHRDNRPGPSRPSRGAAGGPSVPMRRTIIAGRRQFRRKRGAILTTAAATNTTATNIDVSAATSTATNSTTTTTTKQATSTAQSPSTPPPSPQPVSTETVPQAEQALQEEQQHQEEAQQQPSPTGALAETVVFAHPHGPPPSPASILAEQQPLLLHNRRKFRFKFPNEAQNIHTEVLRQCSRKPIGSCEERAHENTMYCRKHACSGINVDKQLCGGYVHDREENPLCQTGFHTEGGRGMSNMVSALMLAGEQSAFITSYVKIMESQKALEWFKDKFGQVIAAPLPEPFQHCLPPLPISSASKAATVTASRSISPETSASLPETPDTISDARRNAHLRLRRLGAAKVDHWWQGTWHMHIEVPLELQLQVDVYNHRRRHAQYAFSYDDAAACPPSSPHAPKPNPLFKDPAHASQLAAYSQRFRAATSSSYQVGITTTQSAPTSPAASPSMLMSWHSAP